MKKVTLLQLFRHASIGFLSTIALPSSLLISPAVSSELNRSTQTQQTSSLELLAADNLVAQSAPLTAQEIQNRLAGQWQIQDIFFVPITVVFTAQGRGFVLIPFFGLNPNANPTAYEFNYQVNNTTQPIQIDIAQPGEEPIKTIFEFTSDGRVRVELAGIKPNEPRPTEFTAGSSLLSRVSNLTTLPRNTEIANSLEAKIREKESQGANIVDSFLWGQQSYFSEKETFTTNIKELDIGIEQIEYEHYTWQVIPGTDISQSVFITATPKNAGLRSFIGAVFVIKDGDKNSPIIGICKSIEPSMTPPALPTLNGDKIQCASGSSEMRDPTNPRFPSLF